jgi:hypothetical protein
MDPLQAATIIMGFNFAFTFGSTLRFYRRRSSKVPVDQRSALTPTLIISLSFLVGLISTVLSYYSLLTLPLPPAPAPPLPPSIDTVFPWIIVAEFVTPLFGFTMMIAVITSLKQPRLYALPAALLVSCYVLSLLSPKHPLDDPYLSLWIAAISLLLVLPMALFAYLWRRTKRTTALGVFVGLILYYAYFLYYTQTLSQYVGSLGFYLVAAEYLGHVTLYQSLIGLMPIMIFVGVVSLSLIYWFFQYSDKKLGGEVIGYSLTIPMIAIEFYLIMLLFGSLPIVYIAVLIASMGAAGIFILGGSYVYGRYRESRARQTLALSLFSFFAGLDFFLFVVGQHIYLAVGGRVPWVDMITLPVGVLTGGFLFIAAMYAVERTSLVLVPAVVIVPLIIMSVVFYPIPLWLLIIMAGAGIILTTIPGGMFGVLWWRMRKAKEKGRGRTLGIFMGFLFMIIASPLVIISAYTPDPVAYLASLFGVLGATFAFVGSLSFFLGVSGRFDRWFYDRRK